MSSILSPSSNGFSRDRMDVKLAAEFDERVREIVEAHCPSGEVEQQLCARIIFGKPLVAAVEGSHG